MFALEVQVRAVVNTQIAGSVIPCKLVLTRRDGTMTAPQRGQTGTMTIQTEAKTVVPSDREESGTASRAVICLKLYANEVRVLTLKTFKLGALS